MILSLAGLLRCLVSCMPTCFSVHKMNQVITVYGGWRVWWWWWSKWFRWSHWRLKFEARMLEIFIIYAANVENASSWNTSVSKLCWLPLKSCDSSCPNMKNRPFHALLWDRAETQERFGAAMLTTDPLCKWRNSLQPSQFVLLNIRIVFLNQSAREAQSWRTTMTGAARRSGKGSVLVCYNRRSWENWQVSSCGNKLSKY